MTREEKREKWEGIVARWQSSGMRQAAWCRQEAIAVASMQQWIVKLRAPQTPKTAGGFVQLDFADTGARAAGCDLLMEVRFGSWSLSLPLAASEGDIRKNENGNASLRCIRTPGFIHPTEAPKKWRDALKALNIALPR